jgi:uncharacterized protein YhbP (UPF0306 family)
MIKNKKVLDIIRRYLKECKLMQVSISANNKPRIFNCWFSYDNNWNFYYISPSTAKHSRELLKNPYVGVSIVSPKISELGVGPNIQGLMFEGVARQVKGKELISAYWNFLAKYPKVAKYIKLIKKKIKMGETKIYKITPKKMIWFDNINFKNPKQNVNFK